MKRFTCGAAAALLVLAMLAAPAAAQSPTEQLRGAALNVLRAWDEAREKPDAPMRLDAEMETLTALIESGQLNPLGLSIASYYRGEAGTLINSARLAARQPADAALARRTLADFDRVIAGESDIAEWGVSIAGAAYNAGSVARNALDLVPQAYAYWEICAQRNHAGCLNIMAAARLTGTGGVEVDLQQSLELHRKVYDTGTAYTCAGAYSALATSEIIYFGARRPVTVDAFEWLKRAHALLDELTVTLKNDSPCSRLRFEVAEYLMRLDSGDDRRPLLEGALKRADTDEEKVMVGYLLGSVSEAEFRKAARGNRNKDEACVMYFAAAWRAEITQADALARDHHGFMSNLGRDHCGTELALLKLKYGR